MRNKKLATKADIKEALHGAMDAVAEKLSATNIQRDELPELSARFTDALVTSIAIVSDRKITFAEAMSAGTKWKAFGAAWKAARAD
jgi:hypothetical protein